MQVKQQLELDMEQYSGSKSRKGYVKAVYCHPAYLTYMQSVRYNLGRGRKGKMTSTEVGYVYSGKEGQQSA